MKYKLDRIKKSIKNEVLKIISEHKLTDPRVPEFLTITKITISKDLHYAHIYFSIFGDDKKKKIALIGLNNASGYIQKILAEKLNFRFTPKIEFRYDMIDDKAYKVDELLNSLTKEREKEREASNNEL